MNANNKSLSKWLFFSVLIITFAILASKLKLMDYADDVTFSNALNNSSIWGFLIERYETWSGRVFIEAIMALTITISSFWKIMIPLCLLSSSYFIWSISLRGRVSLMHGLPLVLAFMLAINLSISGDSQWWITGFYNYLLPATCALFAVSTLLSHSTSKIRVLLAITLSLVATSSEQLAILLIILIPFLYLKSENDRAKNATIHIAYLVALLGAALTLLSPGSYNRFQAEAFRYMPQIFDMNIFQKSIIGVDRLVENIATGRNYCFISGCLSLIFFIVRKGKVNTLSRLCLTVSIAAILLCFTSDSMYMREIKYLTYEGRFYYVDFSNIKVYCCYLFYLMTLICMAAGSIEDIGEERDYSAFITLMAGMLVTVAIGLSPTAYASGGRVLYVFNLCLIVYTLFNIRRIVK